MKEYFTEAIVLDREPSGELDLRVALFTKRFGKMVAKVKSARKITSKLSGHLMPGSLVDVRLIEKNGLQAVDAVKKASLSLGVDFYSLNKILAEAEPDLVLWNNLLSGNISWDKTLKLLGWDPEFAVCSSCSLPKPEAFGIRSQEFFCRKCALGLSQKELLYISGRKS